MRRFVLLFLLSICGVMLFAQEPNAPKLSTVKDTTVFQDMKLLIIADRLYSQNGLFDVLEKEVSKQKAETGESKELANVQKFVEKVNKAYADLEKFFYVVNDVQVDPANVSAKIAEIQQWQQSVLTDPNIKNATTLGVWEQKNEELQKLIKYKKQLSK